MIEKVYPLRYPCLINSESSAKATFGLKPPILPKILRRQPIMAPRAPGVPRSKPVSVRRLRLVAMALSDLRLESGKHQVVNISVGLTPMWYLTPSRKCLGSRLSASLKRR